jgi:hypothetical protein
MRSPSVIGLEAFVPQPARGAGRPPEDRRALRAFVAKAVLGVPAAYDADAVHAHNRALGHAPIIDRNYRAQREAKTEWAKEVERMKYINMPDPDDALFLIFGKWSSANARLKDEFIARFVRVPGAIKVKRHLMFGVVALAVDQILRVTEFRPAPA